MEGIIRIGYLGPEGATFGYRVAKEYAPQGATLVALNTHTDIVQAVSEGRIDQGIVGIENRWDGVVTETTRAIWRYSRGRIRAIGELRTPVVLYCLQRSDGQWPPRVVKSYTAAFGQCRSFLADLAIQGIPIDNASTTGAAAREAAGDSTIAVIASELAAESCGLRKMWVVSDDPRNQTRFLVLAAVSTLQLSATGNDRTTVLVRLANVPGALHQLTGVFATASPSYNLTLLYHDPVEGEFGDYVFWLDVTGHQDDPILRSRLEQLAARPNSFMREMLLLGSYPATANL